MTELFSNLAFLQAQPGVAQQVGDALRSLPLPVHILYLALLVAGLVVWFFGYKLLRPAFALVGATVGGTAGFFFASLFGLTQLLAELGPYVGLVLGGLVGLCLALMLFRVAIGVVAAAVLGLALAAGATAYLHSDLTPMRDRAVERFNASAASALLTSPESGAVPAGETPAEGPAEPDGAKSATELGRQFLETLWRDAGGVIEEIPVRERMIIAGAWIVGTVLGFFMGVALAKHLSIAVTAMFGSAMILGAGVWFAGAHSVPVLRDLPLQPRAAIAIWLALSVVGMVMQWHFNREKTETVGKKDEEKKE